MRWQRPVRWVLDWRTFATFAATVLVLLVAFVIFDAAAARNEALKVAEATANDAASQRAATERRIDLLLDEITRLGDDAELNGQRIGELLDQVNVLQEQVRQLGGQPVVSPTTVPPRPAPRAPAPRQAPRPPTAPSPTTTTPPRQPGPPPNPGPPSTPPGLCVGPLLCLDLFP